MAATGRDALWATGHDESVEVNQRALIDKVLARYSGEFTVFRELLQNSDDAQSRTVEIRFETQAYLDRDGRRPISTNGNTSRAVGTQSLPDLKTTLCHQWTFKNDGMAFRTEDWDRLKKIAEGNPDEEKIGAFGVGFYSLFSVTDDPLVKSGDQWMGFYWKDKKDQLFARRGTLPGDSSPESEPPTQSWTSFEMPLREPVPMPIAFDFARFLASSITFMSYLSEVNVYFDDKRLVRLKKDSGSPKVLGIPRGLQNKSRLGMMNVTGVKTTPLRIQADIMRWVYSSGTEKPKPPALKPAKAATTGFFSSLFGLPGTPQRVATPLPPAPEEVMDPLTVNETSVSLSIFSAEVRHNVLGRIPTTDHMVHPITQVDVRLDKKVAAELYRSTKKNPPSKIKYELIYTAKDEYEASKKEDEQQPFATGSVFQGLRADIEGTGSARVFIGHATGQTTGVGGHMAARFIPTVERESIDLMDRNVAIWNKELLWVGGFLARNAYELELANVKSLWDGAIQKGSALESPDPELKTWLLGRSLHALRFFTFRQSTPSADVSNLLEAAFFSCSSISDLPIMSTVGVRQASDVRYPNPTFSFLKELPVLPDEVLTVAAPMVASLQNRNMIKDITFSDVLEELRSRPLPEVDMVACLNWWISIQDADRARLLPIRTQLLNAAVLILGKSGSAEEQIIQLNAIKTFVNPRSVIPLDGPLPSHLLPVSVSKRLPTASIASSFPWTELSVIQWLQHICSPSVRGATSAVEFNLTLSAPWAERVLMVLMSAWPSLSNEAKVEIVKILWDVPCIPTSAGLKVPEESYFVKADLFHDLAVVTLPSGTSIKPALEKCCAHLGFEHTLIYKSMIKTNEWSIFELTKHLVDVKSSLTEEEWIKLKMTSAFSKEAGPGETGEKRPRFFANQLYEPLDIFRQLGLPVIDWGQHKWRGTSDQARLLFDLGLIRYPPLPVLINLCASPDAKIRPVALKYLLDNMSTRYTDYNPANFSEITYIPALKGNAPCMAAPKDVFANPEWAILGYLVFAPNTQQDAASKLKIAPHPPSSRLVELLVTTPPKNEAEARKWFGVLAGRIADFSNVELKRLSNTAMVPTRPMNIKPDPSLRWLPPTQCFFGSNEEAGFHSKLFVFVDFGTVANGFLSACGTKHSPSVEEVSLMLLADPHRFYELAEGPSNFLSELRNIAVNIRQVSSGTVSKMRKAPILLGSLRREAPSGDAYDDDTDVQYDLKKPEQIVIADDNNALQNFGDSLFTAPQEDILEGFYAHLGSRRLSTLVKEEYKTSAEIKDSRTATEIRALVLERLPLFLHEHTHARTSVTFNWLNMPEHFIVTSYGKVSVTKTLNFGELRKSRTQEASAVAKRIGSGPIQLWLAGNAQVDMYEVATSLNRLLFDSPKTNDALLFMTILSTDIKALKRRGYNVDRILRQQNAVRQAAAEEAAKIKAENAKLLSRPSDIDAGPSMPITTTTRLQEKMLGPPVPESNSKPRPTSGMMGSIQQLRRKLIHGEKGGSSEKGGLSAPPVPNLTRPGPVNAPKPNSKTVTPLSNIASNIDMAVQACRPEAGNLLRNREQMQQVQESLNEGYCDISGRTGDLTAVGEMDSIKVYLSQEVPDTQSFMAAKHEPLGRFIPIMKTLAQIYNLPLTSLHVFYDLDGGLIAFNRDGSIFFNLRYYEAWHDADVRAGITKAAYVSWYFTLAHEIAHNLVHPHNSEHEFYFSAICERYFSAIAERMS